MSITIEHTATVGAPSGLHARPAAALAEAAAAAAARGFQVTIAKDGGPALDAGSILSLMTLGAKQGDVVTISVTGEDVDQAAETADHIIDLIESAED